MDNLINNNEFYFNPTLSDTRPVKIVFESDVMSNKTETYQLTLKEVLTEILKYNYRLRYNLTTQQIHSERGKVRKNNYSEVINFLTKRGISRDYIENEVSQIRERTIFTRNMNFNSDMIKGNFGFYK